MRLHYEILVQNLSVLNFYLDFPILAENTQTAVVMIKEAHWEQAWAWTHSTKALQELTSSNNFWSLLFQGSIQEIIKKWKNFTDISFP